MSKYDEFTLDLRNVKDDAGSSVASATTGAVCTTTIAVCVPLSENYRKSPLALTLTIKCARGFFEEKQIV